MQVDINLPLKYKIVKDICTSSINLTKNSSYCQNYESLGFTDNINDIKNKINNVPIQEWNKIRKIINPFDFPNIFSNDIQIFNRAFYKLWEIIGEFELFSNVKDYSLHIAEAPGSFIYAMLYQYSKFDKQLELNIDNDGYTVVKRGKPKTIKYIDTISLYFGDNIPYYNEKIIKNKYVNFLHKNSSGDVLDKDILTSMLTLDKKYNFITADGGIDEKGCYESKEQLHIKLFLAEILIAINSQNEGGSFILKIYDIFTHPMVNLIYILTRFYQDVYIYKPLTSRITNSEKYLVCKGYISDKDLLNTITSSGLSVIYKEENNEILNFSINPKPSKTFIDQFYKYNQDIIYIQSESIEKALSLINKPMSCNYMEEQVCLKKKNFCKWRKKFNL